MPREFSIPPDARARSKMLFGETTSESEQEEAQLSASTARTPTVEVLTPDGEDLSQREEEQVTQSRPPCRDKHPESRSAVRRPGPWGAERLCAR